MAKQGKLKWYNHVKGYGFISRDEGQKDIFVHVSEFRKAGIKKINYLFKSGYMIKLFTSRYMGRNMENKSKAKKQGYKMTANQLKKWNVNYHKLFFGKPSFDLFVDDKAIYFKKNWHKYINKYI